MVDQKSAAGKAVLYDVIKRRVVIEEVFERSEDAALLAQMSGGSVRDLLRLIRLACEGVTERINKASTQYAIKRMAKEFDRALREENLPALVRIDATQRLAGVQAEEYLLSSRMVHEYENGTRWADLHPILREVPRLKVALTASSQSDGN
jgi:hypothetical protein